MRRETRVFMVSRGPSSTLDQTNHLQCGYLRPSDNHGKGSSPTRVIPLIDYFRLLQKPKAGVCSR